LFTGAGAASSFEISHGLWDLHYYGKEREMGQKEETSYRK
jgi:hypothetical protein